MKEFLALILKFLWAVALYHFQLFNALPSLSTMESLSSRKPPEAKTTSKKLLNLFILLQKPFEELKTLNQYLLVVFRVMAFAYLQYRLYTVCSTCWIFLYSLMFAVIVIIMLTMENEKVSLVIGILSASLLEIADTAWK